MLRYIFTKYPELFNLFRAFAFLIFDILDTDYLLKYVLYLKKLIKVQVINFLKYSNTNNKILILEPNNCHGETIPSVYKYFKDLGYCSDILITPKLARTGCLYGIRDLKVNKYVIPENYWYHILNNPGIIKKYKLIFFNSYNIYIKKGNKNIYEVYKLNIASEHVQHCGFIHRIEKWDFNNKFTPFTLANIPNPKANAIKMLNPHYFGEFKYTGKHKNIRFIMVGAIESERRNCKLLINAVQELHNKGYKNFKIIIIGRGKLENIPNNIRKYFIIKGKLSFPAMYKEMKKADYFLPLLDPDNPEHDRYLTRGTSGSFQLIYGFLMPCLIHEKFAALHGFNIKNSFIYNDNKELALAMQDAIKQSSIEYSQMQIELKKYADELYKISTYNLSSYMQSIGLLI